MGTICPAVYLAPEKYVPLYTSQGTSFVYHMVYELEDNRLSSIRYCVVNIHIRNTRTRSNVYVLTH